MSPTTNWAQAIVGLLVHTVVSLLNYGVGHDDFDATVAEIKRMIVAYLFSIATN